VIVYAVVDDSLSPTSPLDDSIDGFVRRQDAERFIEEIGGDDPELSKALRIERRGAPRREDADASSKRSEGDEPELAKPLRTEKRRSRRAAGTSASLAPRAMHRQRCAVVRNPSVYRR